MSYYIPVCISGHEAGNEICAGIPGSKAEDDKPCVWRDRCAAFAAHLQETGQTLGDHLTTKTALNSEGQPTEYMLAHDFDAFIALVDGVVKTGSKPKPKAQQVPKPKIDRRKNNHPSRKAKAASKRKLRSLAREKRAEMRVLFMAFKDAIAQGLPGYSWAGTHEAIAPGRLFFVDRLKPSRYMSVYCKAMTGRDVPLALFRSKPQRMLVEVELPAAPELYSNAARKKLNPVPVNDGGRFKSKMKGLDKEGIGIAADVLLRLIEQGHIRLPSPRRRMVGNK